MTKRQYIPAMKREILYLIVEKAVVDNCIDSENLEEVSGELKGAFKDDSGYHFIVSRSGVLMADRQLQRPADAATYYNAEGIAIGYIATQDESGATQKISSEQMQTVRTAVTVLQRVFPKATVKTKLTLEPAE
jgi:hypothetical protein